MKSHAIVTTSEAEGLALRMRKHFGHKVPVDTEGGITRVRIPTGEFELEPADGELRVTAVSTDEAGLARVQEVVGSHLVHFARGETPAVRWVEDSLEDRACAWIEGHRNARHLVRTRDWVLELCPDAGEALRLAALLHDVDRNVYPAALERHIDAWDDESTVEAHAELASEVTSQWLRAEGADEELVAEVAALVRLHERGGTEDADILQAADSLSFLETNPAIRWVQEGRRTAEEAERKLRWMHDRIRLEQARTPAAPLLGRATADLVPDGSVIQDSALAGRLRRHANEGRANGNTR
jgi:hypothetical protein